jgi:dTDP-4-dehydrorhamnose 3,5-epimerase
VGTVTSDDIVLTPLPQILAEGGSVFHGMKSSDLGYSGYGEAYFSWIALGAVKAWKRHNKMVMNLIVPVGTVRFVFFSDEDLSSNVFKVIEIGTKNYARITVPPGLWFGFQGIFGRESLILNISNIVHDPMEVERKNLGEVPFDWDE